MTKNVARAPRAARRSTTSAVWGTGPSSKVSATHGVTAQSTGPGAWVATARAGAMTPLVPACAADATCCEPAPFTSDPTKAVTAVYPPYTSRTSSPMATSRLRRYTAGVGRAGRRGDACEDPGARPRAAPLTPRGCRGRAVARPAPSPLVMLSNGRCGQAYGPVATPRATRPRTAISGQPPVTRPSPARLHADLPLERHQRDVTMLVGAKHGIPVVPQHLKVTWSGVAVVVVASDADDRHWSPHQRHQLVVQVGAPVVRGFHHLEPAGRLDHRRLAADAQEKVAGRLPLDVTEEECVDAAGARRQHDARVVGH